MMDGQWSNSLHLTDVQRGGSEFWQLSSIRSTVFFLKKEAHLDFFFYDSVAVFINITSWIEHLVD